MTSSSFNIFDLLIVLCGFYMAYNGVIMKVNGKINPGVVLSRNVDPNAIKDKEGFIKFMWWKLLVIGLICATAGIFNMAVSRMGDSSTLMVIQLVLNLGFFVLLMIYAVVAMKAQSRFLK